MSRPITKSLHKFRLLALLSILAASNGCGGEYDWPGEEGAPFAETAEDSKALYYLSSHIRTQRDIPVCWNTTGNATEKRWVREALRGQRSWSSAGDLNFVGWDSCGSNPTGIIISAGSVMTTWYLDRPAGSAAVMTLDFRATLPNYLLCGGLSREDCIKTVALHEFGHAIGYAHEHNRADTPSSCTQAPQGNNGDTTYGSWDGSSIMNYCSTLPNLSATDIGGTELLYGQRNADSPRLSDYNGDGRDDLLCFDVVDGHMWADYASTSGQFLGTNWTQGNGWCNSDKSRLYAGDFNGDGRDDLLCFDLGSGSGRIDYANSSGQFLGVDWSSPESFCNGIATKDQLLVDDFNGDGRDDLLCLKEPSQFNGGLGGLSIDYADTGGNFDGADWTYAVSWCTATDKRHAFTGDFNADGRADLYCYDIETHEQRIDYASTTGQFTGTDWALDASWCHGAGLQTRFGDFNGDNRDDLLCYDPIRGRYYLDYASSSGQFTGNDWWISSGWCSANGSRLFVGDVNGDGRDDLVCHNVASGAKWVDYADVSGRFAGTDWTIAAAWCGDDEHELH